MYVWMDQGGTFTDVVRVDEQGRVRVGGARAEVEGRPSANNVFSHPE